MFQGIRDWWQRRRALEELKSADRRQSVGFNKYFEEQITIAREAFDRANPEQALKILARARGDFPELAKTSKGVMHLLIDLRAFDEAETMVLEGRKRYPAYEVFARGYIAIAERRGELEETLRRCTTMRAKFPRMAEGYSTAAACLLRLDRPAEAEAMVERGVEMAPDEAELHIQNARNAEQRRDWPEALRRWEVVLSSFNRRFLGHLGTARCLKELSRFDEAEDILSEARERFYKIEWLFAEWADLATAKGDFEEAANRWRAVLKRFPTFGLAYLKGSEALRTIGRTDEVDEWLGLAVDRMRSELSVHLAYARNADWRGDATASTARWALIRERFPDCQVPRKQEREELMTIKLPTRVP